MNKFQLLWLFSFLSISMIAQVPASTVEKKYLKEMDDLAKQRKIKKAFNEIVKLESQTQKDHIYLTEIPAPPFDEMDRAIAFKAMLEKEQFDKVWIDEVGNVLALWKGKTAAKTIAIDGHLDTVFPRETDVKVKIKNDTLFAPGIGDDTRALAMLLTIKRSLDKAKIQLQNDVLFIGTVGEEGIGDLRGVKHLFREDGPKIDSWISIDGGRIGRVNNKGLGSKRYKITYIGPGGHSWGAFGLVNPHHALGTAIDRFMNLADDYTKDGARTSYNVGMIGGGTSVNSIPFESWMQIDMRSESPQRLNEIEALLMTAVQEALDDQNGRKRLGDDLTVKIEKIGDRPSGELPDDLELIQRAMAATAHFGQVPRLTRGSTNSNIPISMNIPAVTIGRGGVGAYGHSLNEWWLNKEGYKAIQLALLLLVSEAGLH